MLKHSGIFLAVVLLTACGGSNSDNTTESATLTLDVSQQSYAALRLNNGNWQQLTGKQEINVNDINQAVTLVTICQTSDSNTIDVIEVAASKLTGPLELSTCSTDGENGYVSIANTSPAINIKNVLLTEIASLTYRQDLPEPLQGATLNNSTDPRTLLAVGYRGDDQKVFIFKQNQLNLTDGDELIIDFTDTDHSVESSYSAKPEKAGFHYYRMYLLSDAGWPLDMAIDDDHVTEVPAALRTAGDYYQETWQFGSNSLYVQRNDEANGINELTSAPEEPALNAVSFAQDGMSTTLTYPDWSDIPLPLTALSVEFGISKSETTKKTDISYTFDPTLTNARTIHFELLDLNTLPGMTLDIPLVKKDDLSGWSGFFYNSESERVLMLNSAVTEVAQ